MILHNRINNKVLKERLQQSNEERITISFYRYVKIADPQHFRNQIFKDFSSMGILGRIYVAEEGINAQISIPKNQKDAFHLYVNETDELSGERLNIAIDDDGKSFFKLKIQVKDKIVADGLNDKSFDVTDRGVHLTADKFNEIISDSNTVLVDMRNHYESEIGHFKGAITPNVDTFKQSLPIIEEMLQKKKDKNIVMYCTGGIRCEKASAYYKHKGFQNVFQLEGGIIEYARQVENKGLENKFLGKNFVFDERLGERISNEVISHCHQCGAPCDTHTNCKNDGCHLLFIQCQKCAEKFEGCCTSECIAVTRLPEAEQKALRNGKKPGRKVFKKGRSEHLLKKSND